MSLSGSAEFTRNTLRVPGTTTVRMGGNLPPQVVASATPPRVKVCLMN